MIRCTRGSARERFFSLLTIATLLSSDLVARDSFVDLPSFRAGSEAFADERFETAATEFQRTWTVIAKEETGNAERNLVAKRLLEALYRSGSTDKIVQWVDQNPTIEASRDVTRWLALAFEKEKEYGTAAKYFRELIDSIASPDADLIVTLATCLARSGDAIAGLDLLRGLSDPPQGLYLPMSRVALSANQPEDALRWALTYSSSIKDDTEVGRVRSIALKRLDRSEEAGKEIATRIDSSATSAEALAWFEFFEALSFETPPTSFTRPLAAWISDPTHPAHQWSKLYEVLLYKEGGERLTALELLLETESDPSLIEKIEAFIAEFTPKTRDPAPESIERQFELTRSAFIGKQFEEALTRSLRLAESETGESESRSLFNAAIAALQSGDEESLSSIRDRLETLAPGSQLLRELEFFIGLRAAAESQPDAFEKLQAFSRDHPGHPLAIEARIALAEIYLNQVPARPQPARGIIEELRLGPLTLEQNERLDYTGVWSEQIEGNHSEIVRTAAAFLSNWPSSRYVPEIAMLLAGNEFRSKHFDSSKKHFSSIAEKFPDSEYADAARFFAAKSTTVLDEAIPKWSELIESSSPLSDASRHELGLLYLSKDFFVAARKQFEALIEREEIPTDLRYAVQSDLAFSWYSEALATGKDEDLLTKAVDAFAEISNDSTAPDFWKLSASVRRGKCLEALGKSDIALEIYRSIVQQKPTLPSRYNPTPGASTSLGERSWIFRAGFSAIEILQSREDWPAVIQIADALSDEEGPRAIEAARLAERTRLQHWVWD